MEKIFEIFSFVLMKSGKNLKLLIIKEFIMTGANTSVKAALKLILCLL